jgi:hypothetical protein
MHENWVSPFWVESHAFGKRSEDRAYRTKTISAEFPQGGIHTGAAVCPDLP